jgi:hypothetical protein
MKEYKLKYQDKQEALQDLMAKGVIIEKLSYNEDEELELRQTPYTSITEAVVYIGNIVDVPATFDEEGEVLTDATFLDGYHVDVMLNEAVDFGENEVVTDKPVHTFA